MAENQRTRRRQPTPIKVKAKTTRRCLTIPDSLRGTTKKRKDVVAASTKTQPWKLQMATPRRRKRTKKRQRDKSQRGSGRGTVEIEHEVADCYIKRYL